MAWHVLLDEAGESAEPAALAGAISRADARLRGRLADLVGQTGYTTLVARAVHLARTEVPALERVTVDAGAAGGDELFRVGVGGRGHKKGQDAPLC